MESIDASAQTKGTHVEEDVRAAIESANLNVLRLALLQATGDESLADMKVRKEPLRGGAFTGYVLSEEHHEEVKSKALEFLKQPRDVQYTADLSDEDTQRLMTLYTGEDLTEREFRYGRAELAMQDFPRRADWTNGRPERASEFEVTIIGAGATGIATAIQFEQLGIRYKILERQSRLGGTWSTNTFPDARVDTNSHIYQYKFIKNYRWSEYFASQAEVREYLEHAAREYGVFDKIQFNTELKKAVFDEESSTWSLETLRDGTTSETFETTLIISAAGLFNAPKLPEIRGIDDFKGNLFHTANWPDDFDERNRRIAVIGNGSTGVQVMPKLAETAEKVYAFQRTPQWISPMEGYKMAITSNVQWLFDNMPFYWNWYNYSAQATSQSMQLAQIYDRAWQESGGIISERNDALRSNLTEYVQSKLGHRPDLLAKSIPDYAPLARRLIVDNGWYDALLRDNVELITDGIDRITPNGIATGSGAEVEVDTIVFAAGFDVARYMWPTVYVGRNGLDLEDSWAETGRKAYLGMCVPEFPNLFILYGPNGQGRAGSFLSKTEMWSRYVARVVISMVENDHKTMEVTRAAFTDFNDQIDKRLNDLIWDKEAPAGKNYYVGENGRQLIQTPLTNAEYGEMLEAPNPDHFQVEKR